jgi:hypothetical protein
VKKKGMIKWLGENGGELVGINKEQISIFVCKTKNLCIQVRFLWGCSGRGSRMLCSLEKWKILTSATENRKRKRSLNFHSIELGPCSMGAASGSIGFYTILLEVQKGNFNP